MRSSSDSQARRKYSQIFEISLKLIPDLNFD